MAIRVLLDHGIPEDHITFLAYLVSARAPSSVHRAFPHVRIVTAAIDQGLTEMHLPLTSRPMGEAAGEADFGVRYVQDGHGDIEETGGDMRGEVKSEEELRADGGREGYKVPVRKATEELKFSRRHRRESIVTEKRAWVVSPGALHPLLRLYRLNHASLREGLVLIRGCVFRYGPYWVSSLRLRIA